MSQGGLRERRLAVFAKSRRYDERSADVKP